MSGQISRAPAPVGAGTSSHLGASNPLLAGPATPAAGAASVNRLMQVAPPPPVSSPMPIIVSAPLRQRDGAAMSRRAAQNLRGLNLKPDQVGKQQARSEYLVHALAELARRAGPVSANEVTAVIMDAVAAGHFSPKEAALVIASIPVDKSKLKTLVQHHHAGHVLAAIHLRGLPGASSSPDDEEG